MRYIIFILFALGCCGCESKAFTDEVVTNREAGEIVKITLVPTSFNESIKSNVETTEGSFIVVGSMSAFKGAKVSIMTHQSGKSYLCIEGVCKRVLGL